ncbi:AMP-binding protein [Candidatus Palauibacter sp.]|uniref:AMP-binding protein n=1 Tax=Candidatus Palauibacter sp. TaxID=3101350 RepID=UPI003B02A838
MSSGFVDGSLPGLLQSQAANRGGRVAMREKEFGIWQSITWTEYARRVRHFAMGLRELGLESGDRIAIVGDNRPEWVIGELAAQSLGALPLGLYQDAVATELEYLLAASRARIVVAEDQEQVDKVLEIREALPRLDHIIYYDPRGLGRYEAPGLLAFPDVERRGAERDRTTPDEYAAALAAVRADDPALLCTTSGTTSKPKLAVLSHSNLLSMAGQLQDVDPMAAGDEFVSFLPLAWIGEQMMTISRHVLVGFPVNFPEEPGTVRQDLREIGPRVMFSPPRIWENLVSEVQVMVEDTTPLKRRIQAWAMQVGGEAADDAFEGRTPDGWRRLRRGIAEMVAMRPIKNQLGLRHLRDAYTGGAALGPDVFRFFHALGVNLKQIYGQTEVAGISVLHRDGDIRYQTVGEPLPGMEVRVAGDGEILTRGPAVFEGYFENPEATRETLVDGWLHSGDAGYFDDGGHLVVVDRLKDVMSLADGTTFSPQFIENLLKFSPYVSEAVVFGGEHPYVAGIIAIDFENAGQWAERRQLAYTTFTDLSQKPEVYDLVRAHVESVNGDVPEAARVRRFLLLHKELHADDAELTRTRKVRRRFVAERFESLIEALYGEDDSVAVEMEITYQDGRTASVTHDLRIARLDGLDGSGGPGGSEGAE